MGTAGKIWLGLIACLLGAAFLWREDAAEREPPSAQAGVAPHSPAARRAQPPAAVHAYQLPADLTDPYIVVSKRERRLRLMQNKVCIQNVRIGLGFAPAGHKERSGDGRTPEGRYYVCVKNTRSKYYLSLGLSYPGKMDAERGLASGLINRTQHDQIARALERRQSPDWNTKLGGAICIHGHGSGNDWTHGCIALENRDMRRLFDAIPLQTDVLILP